MRTVRPHPAAAAGTIPAAVALALAVGLAPTAVPAQDGQGGQGAAETVEADPDSDDPVARGLYVFHAAGCAGCHTEDAPDAMPLAGGRELATPFGTFYGPNITPDPDHGIGDWTEADFRRALKQGRAPEGYSYFPAFPYTSYTAMTDADIADLWAYLQTVPASDRANTPHDVGPPYGWRWLLGPWRLLNFDTDPEAVIGVAGGAVDDRGAYLAEALGHCGQCHSPRGPLGGMDSGRHLAGNAEGPDGETIPNITPDPETGIGDWSVGDMTFLLDLGMTPEGDFVGGSMNEVIENTTANLTEADRRALAEYILSVPAVTH
ncbi:MAG: c-type cytochrome, partial [Alphaproteobacteria bacterium]|nr:c-type cytochrome [Alphaproteobacteria bacterium]